MGDFVEHLPCPECGSSDANSLYDDDSTYCHKCFTYGKGDKVTESKSKGGLIPLQYVPFKKRGISLSVAKKFGLGMAEMRGKPIMLAQYFKAGKLVAQHGRTLDKDFFWLGSSKQVELFGQHLCSGKGALCITEGEIDAVSVAEAMYGTVDVVSVPNGAPSAFKFLKQNHDFLMGYKKFILCFDNDEEGHKATEEVLELLPQGTVFLPTLGAFKDPNEVLLDDPLILRDIIQNAQRFVPDYTVNAADVKLRAVKAGGLPICFPVLSDKLKGLKEKALYIFTAGAGVGKSTLTKEIFWSLKESIGDARLGAVCLEESLEATIMGFMTIEDSVPYHLLDMSAKGLSEVQERVMGNRQLVLLRSDKFGVRTIDSILSKLRYLIQGERCQFVLLDHISLIVSGISSKLESERKLIDLLMTRLRSLVEETGATIVGVVHLSRPDKGKDWSQGRVPTLGDLRGSAALEQLSDVVVGAARNMTGKRPEEVSLYVLKNRPASVLGKADTCTYNIQTGRLLPGGATAFD